jgi:N-acetylmuramic acid 6-phosphate etherase
MTKAPVPNATVQYLGIECGGTRSTAMLEGSDTRERRSWEGGPANLRLMSDSQLVRHFRSIRKELSLPGAIAIGMAGVRTPADRERIVKAADAVWPGVPCFASHDLETAIAAAPAIPRKNGKSRQPVARVLLLSGTGSCCLGRAHSGKTIKIGGWGHFLGDKGSAYEIGLRALKAVVYYLDRDREWSRLGRQILQRLMLNEPNDAAKDQVAGIAMEVFNAATAGDAIARDILEGAAASLAEDAVSCARALAKSGALVQFVYNGSVLLRQPRFAAKVSGLIRKSWKNAVITPLSQPSVAGAVALARQLGEKQKRNLISPPQAKEEQWRGRIVENSVQIIPENTATPPTERRHPRSMQLDRMPLKKAITLFLDEDALLPGKIRPHSASIEKAIRFIVSAFQAGGRLFYIGAGTSGRLGVLDASECPPTFRTSPEMVQGIMAGGYRALWESLEGAEDEADVGAQSVTFRGMTKKDVLVGIAASGRTPFVWGALAEAKRRGSRTILLCCNPHLKIKASMRPDVLLDLDLGPELLTGSTRLKSGTATKLVLNILTTLSMVKMGKVVSNLMIDLNPSNTKLRGRAIGIVRDLTSVDEQTATRALERTGWQVKQAWMDLGSGRAVASRKNRAAKGL